LATYERAAGAATDAKDDYQDEVNEATHKLIARAWADPAFKAELIAKPREAFAELGVHWPDNTEVEFSDDPSANLGDWSSRGKGANAVLQIPIPPAPDAGAASDDDLASVGGGSFSSISICAACTCTGAVSHDTWY
jgi:hypothetical protein